MRHSESNDGTFDLKAKLEDLVDRTGRVEDMLDVLSGIYRKRSRHPEYADLRGQMRATADVLRGASESVASIFGEEDEEVLEHAAGRATWKEAHEMGRRSFNRLPPSPQLQQARMDAMKALLAQQEGTTTANVGAYAVPLGPPTKNPFPNPAASGWESASVRALRALKAGDAEYLRALKAMGWLP
jgi:hypothetical protein